MKKILSFLFIFVLLSTGTVFAADNQNISDKLNNIWLSPERDAAVLDNIKKLIKKK